MKKPCRTFDAHVIICERETNQSLQCHAETCVPSNDICLQLSRMHILYMLTPIERSDMVHGE